MLNLGAALVRIRERGTVRPSRVAAALPGRRPAVIGYAGASASSRASSRSAGGRTYTSLSG